MRCGRPSKFSRVRIVLSTLLPVLIALSLLSCTGCPLDPFPGNKTGLSLMSYNLQNLFDDVSQGGEYPEYDPLNGDWGREAYDAKLAAIATVIRRVEPSPDLILVQEAENTGVLERLADEFLPLKGYDYIAAPLADGAAAQTGVLATIPIRNLRIHRAGGSDSERNILELDFLIDGARFVLFNAHWKSRIGGTEATEEERVRAAELILRRIRELEQQDRGIHIILAGDLNCDPYRLGEGYTQALAATHLAPAMPPVIWVATPGTTPKAEGITLYSGWENLPGQGSYYYSGLWERIDHFLWTESLGDGTGWDVTDFLVWKEPLILNQYGTPLPFSAERLEGYSDHLPLLLRLEKRS